jgi:hypothetical protein
MRTRRSAAIWFICSASVGGVGLGCSAPVGATPGVSASGEASASEPLVASAALVLIERTVSPGARVEDSARAEAIARFVRMRAGSVDDEALRMVGAAVDLPSVGACQVLRPANPARAADTEAARAIELVDVGSVSIETNGVSLSLPARRLPDILDLVSGVVYSTRAPDPEALPSEATYVLRASGRASLNAAVEGGDPGPFVIAAVAPAALGAPLTLTGALSGTSNATSNAVSTPGSDTLLVGGQDARTSGPIVLSGEAPVDLEWAAGNPEDTVYVDVVAAGLPNAPNPASTRGVRCSFGDTGHAVIPTSTLIDGEGTLTIHRLHREFFQAKGIDSGEIRFDFARVLPFRR